MCLCVSVCVCVSVSVSVCPAVSQLPEAKCDLPYISFWCPGPRADNGCCRLLFVRVSPERSPTDPHPSTRPTAQLPVSVDSTHGSNTPGASTNGPLC